jgi:hypothetical protein
MWLRLTSICVFALAFQTAYQGHNAQALRQKYGAPITESYLVRPGVIASASYGPSGDVCEIVLSPQRLWNSTLDSKEVNQLTEELVPTRERGKVATGGVINGACPTNDCSGADYEWEKLSIVRWGGDDQVRYVTIRWHRDECQFATK